MLAAVAIYLVQRPSGTALQPWSADGADPTAYAAELVSENLVRAAATPHDVVDAWLGSSGHRANLLDPTLQQVGIGCLLDGDEMRCSQVFLGS